MKTDTTIKNDLDYRLKFYQMMREIEDMKEKKEKKEEKEKTGTSGNYSDLLKYRRGRSKH